MKSDPIEITFSGLWPKDGNPAQILCLCTANRCRSILAEAFFKSLAAARGIALNFQSAGTDAVEGMSATEETRFILQEKKLDIPKPYSQRVTESMVQSAHLIFVMEKNHFFGLSKLMPSDIFLYKTYLLGSFHPDSPAGDQDIPDPLGLGIHAHSMVAGLIEKCCAAVLDICGEIKAHEYALVPLQGHPQGSFRLKPNKDAFA